jgi:hypothetical protein
LDSHKWKLPSLATVLAFCALFVALGGSAFAAKHFIDGKNIAKGSIPFNRLTKSAQNKLNTKQRLGNGSKGDKGDQGPKGDHGPKGDQGPKGNDGAPGSNGHDGAPGSNGHDGANPGVLVNDAPNMGSNPSPPTSGTGDHGFYITGGDSDCGAAIARGGLELTGVGVDPATVQGGCGAAKAFDNVDLSTLNALAYDYSVNVLKGNQAPGVHVTVMGLTHDSKFTTSGFANLNFVPALNGVTAVGAQQAYHADGFVPGAKWYSTTETNISDPGGQDNPQSLSYFVTNNPNAKIIQISLDNGGSSGASGDFAALADNLVIGFSGSPFARYDFGG